MVLLVYEKKLSYFENRKISEKNVIFDIFSFDSGSRRENLIFFHKKNFGRNFLHLVRKSGFFWFYWFRDKNYEILNICQKPQKMTKNQIFLGFQNFIILILNQ